MNIWLPVLLPVLVALVATLAAGDDFGKDESIEAWSNDLASPTR